MKCVIIDYGMGNLRNVQKACEKLGYSISISADKDIIKNADQLILPGVGAFRQAINNLEKMEIKAIILEHIAQGKPLLGICLGMQLLFEESEEHGIHKGLGVLEGRIKRFDEGVKIPHIGWNTLEITKESPLFVGVQQQSFVYFVHSYHLDTEADVVSAFTSYKERIPVAVQKGNVFGMQYHPEKSGAVGLRMLENFLKQGR